MNALFSPARFPTNFGSVRHDLDRWFDQFFSPAMRAAGGDADTWRAPAAVWEEADTFHVEVELPGVCNEDVDITYEKGGLTVTAERKSPEGDRKYWHHDRNYGTLQFSLRLPEAVDGEEVDAELKHGILHLKLAKRPESQPKKITVKSSD